MNKFYLRDEDEQDSRNPQLIIRGALRWSIGLAVLLWALILGSVAYCSRADAAIGLAVVTRDASVAGRLVKDVSPTVVYATPKPGDYVRVADVEANVWTTGAWKPWPIASGEQAEVCTSDVGEETNINATSGNCTAWNVVALTPKDPRTFALSWQHDGHDTTGAVVALTGFRLVYGTDASALTQTVTVSDGAARSYPLQVPKFATTYYVAITALAGAQESVKSNTISATTGVDPSVPPPVQTPTPPVLAFKTASRIAYGLAQTTNKITIAAVGTVPLGLPCTRIDTPSGVLDVLKDRTKAVIPAGKTRPSAVVVKCS